MQTCHSYEINTSVEFILFSCLTTCPSKQNTHKVQHLTNKLSQSDITINGIAADISNNIKLNLTDLYISDNNNEKLNAELLNALTYIIP